MTTRVSVSFQEEHYSELQALADEDSTSLASLVRRAVRQFLEDKKKGKLRSTGSKRKRS